MELDSPTLPIVYNLMAYWIVTSFHPPCSIHPALFILLHPSGLLPSLWISAFLPLLPTLSCSLYTMSQCCLPCCNVVAPQYTLYVAPHFTSLPRFSCEFQFFVLIFLGMYQLVLYIGNKFLRFRVWSFGLIVVFVIEGNRVGFPLYP